MIFFSSLCEKNQQDFMVWYQLVYLGCTHSRGCVPFTWAAHLSTAVAWREKKSKHFVFNKYFSLVLGLLKSRISEKIN